MGWCYSTNEKPIGLLGQTNLTICDMCKVVIQNTEPVSTREDIVRLVKILDITYEKSNLEQLSASVIYLNTEDRTKKLTPLKDF